MTDAHQPASGHASEDHSHSGSHDDSHEGPIKTPKQLIAAVVAAFVVPIIAIILFATYVNHAPREGAGADAMNAEAIARRIQPIGTIEVRDASAGAAVRSGEDVFKAQCAACHATGAAGAPKLGDGGAWAPRLTAGYDGLLNSALKGKGAMAPQGGGDFSDFEIGRAVVYMANQGGGKLAEPKPPAGAASAPDGAASK